MGNPNFVHDLVQMAKAFEELPQVQNQLMDARVTIDAQQATIQRLELKLIERANEIDNLNAAVRKAEVERDHAERMFLETDDRLHQFRQLVQRFQAEVETYDAAVPTKEVPAEPVSTEHYAPVPGTEYSEPKAEPAIMSEDHIDGPFPYGKGESAQVVQVPTEITEPADLAHEAAIAGVSVPSDPTPASLDAAQSLPDLSASAGENSATTASAGPTLHTDDVGYHNEPKIGTSSNIHDDWSDWELWQRRMDARYGVGQWPRRDVTPQASQASQYSF